MKIISLLLSMVILSGCATTHIPKETKNHLDIVKVKVKFCEQIKKSEYEDGYFEVKRVWSIFNDYFQIEPNNKKRKLVIFMDGTSNNKNSNTNIWKLYKLSLQQACSAKLYSPIIPYYDRGLGANWYDFITGNVKGKGAGLNILQAYNFLVQTYQKDDEIYIFGFSRGAFTARSLNGMLENVGLLKRNKIDSIKRSNYIPFIVDKDELIMNDLYTAYNTHHDGTPSFIDFLKAKILIAKKNLGNDITHKITVSAIGLFDTVAAISEDSFLLNLLKYASGTILYHDPDNHRTDLYATEGYHALSIDEQRTAFQLLRFPDTYDLKNQVLKEVWFSGAHSSVGGGDDLKNGLSKISLEWMVSKFEDKYIFPTAKASSLCKQQKPACEEGELEDMFFKTLWNKGGVLHRWPRKTDIIHESVFCRKTILKDEYKTLNLRDEKKYYPHIEPYQCGKPSN